MVQRSCASHARSLTLTSESPGATIQPFCEPDTTTSRPQASVSTAIEESDEIASTISSRSCRRTTCAISSSGLVTPVEVSLCVTSTVRISPSGGEGVVDAVRVGGRAVLEGEVHGNRRRRC